MNMRWQYAAAGLTLAITFLMATSSPVAAHGFGERYDLPFPLPYYLGGAGMAVAVSFVIMAMTARQWEPDDEYPAIRILRGFVGSVMSAQVMTWSVRLIGISAFVLVVIAGFYGTPVSSRNISVVIIWVIFWVGLAYSSALIGNIWVLLNPWDSMFRIFEAVVGLIDPRRIIPLNRQYPAWLSYWPAFALFLVFAWIESAFTGSSTPKNLATFVAIYSFVTFAGMFVFGRRVWLRQAEAFTAFFSLLARFSPTEVAVTDRTVCEACSSDCEIDQDVCVDCYECYEIAPRDKRNLYLRPYATGLRAVERISTSQMVLVLTVLATVSFDGFTATSEWVGFFDRLFPIFESFGSNTGTAINSVGLAAMIGVFVSVYIVLIQFVIIASGQERSAERVARKFVLSLVPIALAYHLAHFFSFLLIQGQLVIPLLSDPLGHGWDLFGTTDYVIELTIVNARATWLISIAAIITGHIFAVYLAHMTALKTFTGTKAALRSQYPMLILMVGYTMVGLWILAQPIVNAE